MYHFSHRTRGRDSKEWLEHCIFLFYACFTTNLLYLCLIIIIASGPPTVDSIMEVFWKHGTQWKIIAELFGFNEDLVDEVYTNDETDEACLRNCVEQWVARLDPTWEMIALVKEELERRTVPCEEGECVIVGCGVLMDWSSACVADSLSKIILTHMVNDMSNHGYM